MRYVLCVLAMIIAGGASAQTTWRSDPGSLVGNWRIGTDSGAIADEVGVMSIQPGGRITIAGIMRLRSPQSMATLSDREARTFLASVVIMSGRYTVQKAPKINIIDKLTVEIDEASDPSLIGTRLDFAVKLHSRRRIAIGIGDTKNVILNNIWLKVSP